MLRYGWHNDRTAEDGGRDLPYRLRASPAADQQDALGPHTLRDDRVEAVCQPALGESRHRPGGIGDGMVRDGEDGARGADGHRDVARAETEAKSRRHVVAGAR